MNTRPLAVTIVAYVYIAMGTIGFAYHFSELMSRGTEYDIVGVELLRVLAVVCGIFMLRGQNWARWVALAWIALHVIVSAFHAWPELVIHCVFLGVIAWSLFHPVAARYFRAGQ